MISKTLAGAVLPLARRTFTKNTPSLTVMATRLDHHGPPAGYKHPTMDELPVPCGSWQEHYDNQQRKFNIHLLLGTGFFFITMMVGIYTGAFDLYLVPPKVPGKRPCDM